MASNPYLDQMNEKAWQVRRELLGDAYVEARKKAPADPFMEEFQQLVNHYCFAEMWARSGLSRKVRSSITIAMLIALNRPDELRVHVRAGLRNGVSKDELKEIFLHASIYCGVPAGVEAFKAAKAVFAEIEREEAEKP